MFLVVTYDINTENINGQRRLRKLSKECLRYGQRVQNSVYECNISQEQYIEMKNKLTKIIDKNKDSLRFYLIGDKYKNKVEHYGTKNVFDMEDVLIL